MSALELKVPPLLLVLIFGGLMAACATSVPAWSFRETWTAVIAVLLFCVGVAFVAGGVLAFRQHRTTMNPLNPAASSALVSSGIYSLSRNPMYLGFLFLLLGFAFVLCNGIACVFPALFVLYMNRFQIRPEERALSAKYGAVFSEYAAQVRRWL